MEESEALEIGTALYHLSLRYWMDGRLTDAIRVGSQAAAVLRELAPMEIAEKAMVRLHDFEELERQTHE